MARDEATEGAELERSRALWQLIREDRLSRWIALAALAAGWFALTWQSASVAFLLPLLAVALFLRERRAAGRGTDDELDDLY